MRFLAKLDCSEKGGMGRRLVFVCVVFSHSIALGQGAQPQIGHATAIRSSLPPGFSSYPPGAYAILDSRGSGLKPYRGHQASAKVLPPTGGRQYRAAALRAIDRADCQLDVTSDQLENDFAAGPYAVRMHVTPRLRLHTHACMRLSKHM